MDQYLQKDYTGGAFELYGPSHQIALTAIVIACFVLICFGITWDERQRRNFRYFMAIFLIVDELSWHAWAAYWGIWTVQTMLPLHICSIMVWASAYMLFTKNYNIYEMAYFLGVGGATQALLTPDANQYGFPHYRAFQTFIAHGLLVIIPIYLTVVEGYRPTLQSFKRVFIWTNIYMIFVFFVNLAISSNYLFIAHKPEFPTLLDVLVPWPWYVFQLEAIGCAIFFLIYMPFLIKDLKAGETVTNQINKPVPD